MPKRLEETVGLMLSEDYKDRLKAEYWQLKLRYNDLHEFLIKYEAGMEIISPPEKSKLMQLQARVMEKYLKLLEERAVLEGMDLESGDV